MLPSMNAGFARRITIAMKRLKVHPNCALIVVDVQNDFLPGGALAVPEGDAVVEPVNSLMHCFDLVVLTADWHPADHESFAANHPGKKPFESVRLNGVEQVLWPAHCIAGSSGALFSDALNASCAALIVRKGMRKTCDSYSAFVEADRKTRTGLAGWFREREVEEVYVCGLALDFCVSATAFDAAEAGFQTTVVLDACRAINSDAQSLRELADAWHQAGIRTMSCSEVREKLA